MHLCLSFSDVGFNCSRRNSSILVILGNIKILPTFRAGGFPKEDRFGKFLSELLVEGDVDHRVDHGVHVGQHVDPEHVPLQHLWQLKETKPRQNGKWAKMTILKQTVL